MRWLQNCVEREENKRMGNGKVVVNTNENVTVQLDEKTYKELGRCAHEQGITKTEVVRALIMNYCRTGL